MTDATQLLRIGELSRRTGVRTETLRAWERRYGLVEPNRSEGGYRLYTPDDERRINAMNASIAAGTAPAEAARLARAGAGDPAADVGLSPDSEAERLRSALEGYDEERANAILDRAIAAFALDSLLGGVILPAMAALGDRWAGGEVSVAQEHFATSVVRGRLLGLARGWGAGAGSLALLACPAGERHDIGLIAFGLSLRQRGWRIAFLGPETPVETLAEAAERLAPEAVVLAASSPEPFRSSLAGIRDLTRSARVLLGGAGAEPELATEVGAELLAGSPPVAAASVSI